MCEELRLILVKTADLSQQQVKWPIAVSARHDRKGGLVKYAWREVCWSRVKGTSGQCMSREWRRRAHTQMRWHLIRPMMAGPRSGFIQLKVSFLCEIRLEMYYCVSDKYLEFRTVLRLLVMGNRTCRSSRFARGNTREGPMSKAFSYFSYFKKELIHKAARARWLSRGD